MHIKLGSYNAAIKIIDWDPDDPDYVVWEFADKGMDALATCMDLYSSTQLIELFEKASAEERISHLEDIAEASHDNHL